jgi:2,3-bisphosphoglycerate-dependent phosphoglycerate mutase
VSAGVSAMSIFIARHAETEQGAARVVQVAGAQLSALGRSQAGHLARRAGQIGITRILSSDLARAVETAQIIARHVCVPLEQDPVLRERDFGALRGLPYSEITFDPFAADYVPPEGESWTAFFERAALAWKRVAETAAQAPGSLLVVTHGLLCHALAQRHWHRAGAEVLPQAWTNTGLTEVEPMPPWKVVRMNCAAHLEPDPSAEDL